MPVGTSDTQKRSAIEAHSNRHMRFASGQPACKGPPLPRHNAIATRDLLAVNQHAKAFRSRGTKRSPRAIYELPTSMQKPSAIEAHNGCHMRFASGQSARRSMLGLLAVAGSGWPCGSVRRRGLQACIQRKKLRRSIASGVDHSSIPAGSTFEQICNSKPLSATLQAVNEAHDAPVRPLS